MDGFLSIKTEFIPQSYDELLIELFNVCGIQVSHGNVLYDTEKGTYIPYNNSAMRGVCVNYINTINSTVDDGMFLRIDNSKIFNKLMDYLLIKYEYTTGKICSTYSYTEDSKSGPYGIKLTVKDTPESLNTYISTNKYYNKSLRFIELLLILYGDYEKENINLGFLDTTNKLYFPVIFMGDNRYVL